MATGKSIRIYLPDAAVTGIRYAELVNWTGQAIACPRKRLNELKESWREASKPGVYFLFENRFGDTKPLAYIGESENVMDRLITHDKNKEFWNEVVIFTSKDQNLTKSHIKYLEASIVSLAKNAGRYELENGNTPPESSLPRPDRDAMDEFLENSRMVLGVLGHEILEPLLKKFAVLPSLDKEEFTITDNAAAVGNLVFTVNNLKALGRTTDEGFVLAKGSQVAKKSFDSIPGRVAQIKQGLIQSDKLVDEGMHLVAKEDILLSSSSYAAALVAGTSRSGPQSWKDSRGRTLKQLEENLSIVSDTVPTARSSII